MTGTLERLHCKKCGISSLVRLLPRADADGWDMAFDTDWVNNDGFFACSKCRGPVDVKVVREIAC